jgi:ATPase family associated with various cellular activities (AAA)
MALPTKKTEETPKTRSQQVAADVSALIRSRSSCLWIVTKEEARVESHLITAIAAAGYQPRFWDIAQGAVIDDRPIEGTNDPGAVLDLIATASKMSNDAYKKRGVWVLRDLPPWLEGPGGLRTLRQVRNNAKALNRTPRDVAQAMIILSPSAQVPPELSGHATVIEWPLPDRAEIAKMLDTAVETMRNDMPNGITMAVREAAIDAAVGLSGEEAQACFARSLVKRRIDPAMIAGEKKRVVAQGGLLEWYDPIPEGLGAVGGLDQLKDWLNERKQAFSPKARAYGLPSPKGALLIGISGCGKSLTAKATATAFDRPLLRLDLGALKNKYVGGSEANLRKALNIIASVGRCVVWLDEVEKALAGATQGAADGGVSADVLGTLLSWMQERQGEAFVVATANDISGLPPEFLRKGRFDEIWFIDLPNRTEREEVLRAALRAHKRGSVKIDHAKVAEACAEFTGSEIAAIVPDALFLAFADNAREIKTHDLTKAAARVVPLSKTMKEKITELRSWARERARPATTPEQVTRVQHERAGRQVDLEELED